MKYTILASCLFFFHLSSAQGSNEEVNTFIDNWHKAATEANSKIFFGSMSTNSIYIGTDASERWTMEEFRSFAQPYFDRGKAWNFVPFDRSIQHYENTIWFSELLHTWMGVCRGSGIIINEKGSLKIAQYHLSVTVPNDIIQDFIDLVENSSKVTSDEPEK